jgi:hypothetical protein
MPDTQGNPTPEEVMAQKTAELEQMRADIAAERAELAAQRTQNDDLNRTMAGLTDAIRQQNSPAPQPDPDLEGEFDEATLRAAGALAKKQLEAYHNEMAPVIHGLRTGQFESEWERARADDPKNFGRLETSMRKHFEGSPHLKSPGAVSALFTQMKGYHYNKLQEMDRADRQKEIDNPEPNPTSYLEESKKKSAVDSLDENEWGLIRGMGRDREGTPNVEPEHYFLAKYGRYPNFEEKYLETRGYKPVERGS